MGCLSPDTVLFVYTWITLNAYGYHQYHQVALGNATSMLDILAVVTRCLWKKKKKEEKGTSRAGASLSAPNRSSNELAALQKEKKGADDFDSFSV